jgi:hypothetical protein
MAKTGSWEPRTEHNINKKKNSGLPTGPNIRKEADPEITARAVISPTTSRPPNNARFNTFNDIAAGSLSRIPFSPAFNAGIVLEFGLQFLALRMCLGTFVCQKRQFEGTYPLSILDTLENPTLVQGIDAINCPISMFKSNHSQAWQLSSCAAKFEGMSST